MSTTPVKQNSATEAGSDSEEVSLEELFADSATPPTPPVNNQNSNENKNQDEMAQVDALIANEDPIFSRAMAELKRQNLDADVPPDDLMADGTDAEGDAAKSNSSIGKKGKKKTGGFGQRLIALAKTMATAFLNKLEQGALWLLGAFKRVLGGGLNGIFALPGLAFKAIKKSIQAVVRAIKSMLAWPRSRQVSLLMLIALSAGVGYLSWRYVNGQLRPPHFHDPFIPSVAYHADHVWQYKDDDSVEDFYNPLRHPEYVVQINNIVVNLKWKAGEGRNPMGLFGFYLEASSQAAAVEIRDRESEVQDVISRVLEGQVYEDLSTPEGKSELKRRLRYHISQMMTRGRIRRVYVKDFVLKP